MARSGTLNHPLLAPDPSLLGGAPHGLLGDVGTGGFIDAYRQGLAEANPFSDDYKPWTYAGYQLTPQAQMFLLRNLLVQNFPGWGVTGR
ncbi:hypothetical protein [Bauldia sp.]|uniref:hypothetical protein n=1 Tax=Bauldia sp. TaxID=2575872 RepID=UPI003BAB3E29